MIKFKVAYNPEFYHDIEQAVYWYEEQLLGLGQDLLMNVKKQTRELSTTALHFAVKYDDVRRLTNFRILFITVLMNKQRR